MADILVIDNDVELRAILRRMLVRAGHAVIEASEGREGLAVCQARAIALVIMALVLPKQDGFNTISALGALVPVPKILAISGLAHLGILGMARRLGADRTLAKPVAQADLLAAVRGLLAEP
jgi:DNA-binding response OmpR family regulator